MEINGQPSIAILAGGEPVTVLSICASGSGIERLFWMLNPKKLERIAIPVAA
jgi:RNA polymerase sigma-70 factor (ECF subfamily)